FYCAPAIRLCHAPCSHVASQHAGCSVCRILIIRRMLISKPERQPGSIRALGAREILESVLNCAVDRPIAESPVGVWTGFAFVLHKFSQGTNGVSRQIRSTAIEGERTPAPAKSRPAAVAVLKLQQPAHSAGERVENQVVRCCGNLTLSRRTG